MQRAKMTDITESVDPTQNGSVTRWH